MSLHWNDINISPFQWVPSFSRIIKSCAPTSLGDTVLISSDYSGDLANSKYYVASFVIINLSKITEWDLARRIIRKDFLKDNRRMSFKGLNDAIKRDALPHFLTAADLIKGLHVNVVVDKRLNNLVYSDILFEGLTKEKKLKYDWKKHTFNKMCVTTHFVSLLIAGFSEPNQNIYWYSDEDLLFANDKTSIDVSTLLGIFSSNYIKIPLGELGIGTTKLNQADFLEEDINAIPDLSAGCLSEFFNKAHDIVTNNTLRDFAYLFPEGLTQKTIDIIKWLEGTNKGLKKVTVVFDKVNKNDGYKIWRFDTTDISL